MKAQALLWDLLRLALLAAGLYYAVEVALAYARSEAIERPVTNGKDPLRSAGKWLIYSGVITVTFLTRLAAPILNVLSDASAEVGEWAISRHHTRAPVRASSGRKTGLTG